jgi:hypothetical protein
VDSTDAFSLIIAVTSGLTHGQLECAYPIAWVQNCLGTCVNLSSSHFRSTICAFGDISKRAKAAKDEL